MPRLDRSFKKPSKKEFRSFLTSYIERYIADDWGGDYFLDANNRGGTTIEISEGKLHSQSL